MILFIWTKINGIYLSRFYSGLIWPKISPKGHFQVIFVYLFVVLIECRTKTVRVLSEQKVRTTTSEEWQTDSDVGDLVMVTDLSCWWQKNYVGDFLGYVTNFSNVIKRSSSKIRHQHTSSPTFEARPRHVPKFKSVHAKSVSARARTGDLSRVRRTW